MFASFFKCLKCGAERKVAVASVVCISSVRLLRALPVKKSLKTFAVQKAAGDVTGALFLSPGVAEEY